MVSGDLLAMGVEWRSGSQAAGRRVDYKRLWSSGEQSRAGLGTEGRASSWVEAGKELVDVLGSHLWGVTSVLGARCPLMWPVGLAGSRFLLSSAGMW